MKACQWLGVSSKKVVVGARSNGKNGLLVLEKCT